MFLVPPDDNVGDHAERGRPAVLLAGSSDLRKDTVGLTDSAGRMADFFAPRADPVIADRPPIPIRVPIAIPMPAPLHGNFLGTESA